MTPQSLSNSGPTASQFLEWKDEREIRKSLPGCSRMFMEKTHQNQKVNFFLNYLIQWWSRKPGGPRSPSVPSVRHSSQGEPAEPFWRQAACSVWSLIRRDPEGQINVSINSFHYLLCPLGTAQDLISKRLLPVRQGCEETRIAKVIRSKAYFHPSNVHGGLKITKSSWHTHPHFILPSGPWYSLPHFRLTYPS